MFVYVDVCVCGARLSGQRGRGQCVHHFFADAFPALLDWAMFASPPSLSTLFSPSALITA